MTIHLEGVDLHTNPQLALTREHGKIGSVCNETYFVARDLPVTSVDGSSVDIVVDESLHAQKTSWNLCVRQQTPDYGKWTHIGKYERYPSGFTLRNSEKP